ILKWSGCYKPTESLKRFQDMIAKGFANRIERGISGTSAFSMFKIHLLSIHLFLYNNKVAQASKFNFISTRNAKAKLNN
ncbi:hypothetical protein KIN20_001689, partial [Parelaphostrongylus tenuis]